MLEYLSLPKLSGQSYLSTWVTTSSATKGRPPSKFFGRNLEIPATRSHSLHWYSSVLKWTLQDYTKRPMYGFVVYISVCVAVGVNLLIIYVLSYTWEGATPFTILEALLNSCPWYYEPEDIINYYYYNYSYLKSICNLEVMTDLSLPVPSLGFYITELFKPRFLLPLKFPLLRYLIVSVSDGL